MVAQIREASPTPTFLSLGAPRFEALWRAAMHQECPHEMQQLFADLLSPWATRPIPKPPQWASDIGDDHTPYEFSLAVGGARPELRVLVEAQADVATPAAYWEAGLALSERLAKDHGAVLTQFRKIQDLFVPQRLNTQFCIWHAVCLFPDAPPAWKLYLNPQSQGRRQASSVVREALRRLGYPGAWESLSRFAAARGNLDELKYFSLDLSARPEARVKIYFRHHHATAAELETAFSCAKSHQKGDVVEFCQAMLEGSGPFREKPVGSCFSFVGGDSAAPAAATLHLPVNRYVESDEVVRQRVTAYLASHDIPVDSYSGPVAAFADRDLSAAAGMHSYASFRRENGRPRVTVYLAPEVYSSEDSVASGVRSMRWGVPPESVPSVRLPNRAAR